MWSNFYGENRKGKGKQKNKTKQKQTNKHKRQGRKGYTNNPGGRALTLPGTPWCDDNSKKEVQKQLVSGKIEKSLAFLV